MARHGVQVSARPNFQALAGSGAQGVHGPLKVRRLNAGRREGQVGVRVDKARHDDAPGGVDLDGAARLGEILDAPAGPHFDQDSVANEDSPILNHIEFIE